jgi:hypothetical protein
VKIRRDFVTNSSSSSFIISKDELDQYQIEAIRKHSEIGELLGIDCSEEPWRITENDFYITGFTCMDNFDMYEFLRVFGVDVRNIKWSEYKIDLPDT